MNKKVLIIAFLVNSSLAFSQKYKSLADTIKLNKEYLSVTNDIVNLKAKLDVAKNELPVLKATAIKANVTSKSSAAESSRQAYKATNAALEELKEADKKASKALKDGYAAKSADDDIRDMEEKIISLNEKVNIKQIKLKDLEKMRTYILSVIRVVADTTRSRP